MDINCEGREGRISRAFKKTNATDSQKHNTAISCRHRKNQHHSGSVAETLRARAAARTVLGLALDPELVRLVAALRPCARCQRWALRLSRVVPCQGAEAIAVCRDCWRAHERAEAVNDAQKKLNGVIPKPVRLRPRIIGSGGVLGLYLIENTRNCAAFADRRAA
jgi:hypothetical protein